ncbi:MAG TPA: glycosyltransferase family 4 protein [Terracidiphilus sp.]|jgi:glycosyltransferase involved in cell wall biosynthesis|nr:glycosyltransferase family 4 protein [Terracidiphilus sp.]
MSTFRKIRILYINHTGQVSGAERVLIDTLRVLDRKHYEPIVMCPLQGNLVEEIFATGAEWLPIPSIRARFSWRPDRVLRSLASILSAVWILRKQIRALGPDLIHANSVRAGLVASLAATGTRTPVIWHVHDTLPQHPLSTALRMFVLIARNTQLIAVSRQTARCFVGHFPLAAKAHTIHNGVDLSRFTAERSERRTYRDELGIAQEEFLVCAVGQICARKGLLELLDAFRQVHSQAPRMHLAIVGRVVFRHEEDYLQALHEAAKSWAIEDRVHFCGERRNVSAVLHGSDLLVLSSRDEPFGLVLIEAMACGTPVLATRVGGIPEIVVDAENGWLVEPGNTPALAAKLLELSRCGSALRQTVEQAQRATCPKFSLEQYKTKLAALYTELCNQRDRGSPQEIKPALVRSPNH